MDLKASISVTCPMRTGSITCCMWVCIKLEHILTSVSNGDLHGYLTVTLFLSSLAGPMVDPSMQFSLVSPRDADPPVFTLSFNSTQGPPTAVNCTVDGDPVVVTAADLSRLVHRFTFPSVVEVAVTFRERRGGMYNCTVTLMGVNEESQFFTIGTSYSTLEMQGIELL